MDVRRTQAGMLRTPPGFALAVDLLNEAEARGCTEIVVSVQGGGKYEISFQGFMDKSFPIQRGSYERQRAITLEQVNRIGPKIGGRKSTRALDKMRKARKPQQPTFRGWG